MAEANLTTAVVILLSFIMVGLVVAVVILALQAARKPCPPLVADPPAFVGFMHKGLGEVWPVQTEYRYALFNPDLQTTGVWSPASAPVCSAVAAWPAFRVVRQPPFAIIWQRRAPEDGGQWLDAVLTPFSEAQAAAGLPADVQTAEVFVDQHNPAASVNVPPPAPGPSAEAPFSDQRGCSWAARGRWPLPTRFACRLVGASPGPWGPWSEHVWVSDMFTDPLLQAPVFAQVATEWTASWLDLTPSSNQLTLLAGNRPVHTTLPAGRTTLDHVLGWLSHFFGATLHMPLHASFVCGRVVLRLVDPSGQNVAHCALGPFSVLRVLGFSRAPELTATGCTAEGPPRFSYRPHTVLNPGGTFVEEVD
jgi:hypothetical protein